MKRFLVLFAIMAVCAGVANAQPYIFEHNNEIGVYTSAALTAENAQDLANYNGPAGQFNLYVCLTNPYNTTLGAPIAQVGGFEFRLVLPAGMFILQNIFPAGTANFASAPGEYLCGANTPVVGGVATLVTLFVFYGGTPGTISMTPVVDAPVTVPGNIAILDFNDNMRLSLAHPVSGSFDMPVFGLNSSVVPTEDAAWGDVKSMFR